MSVLKLAIILILFVSIASCSSSESGEEQVSSQSEFPDQESWNSIVTLTKNGQKVSVIQASHYKKFSNKNIAFISEGLKADFYNEYGQHTSVLTSMGGEVNDVVQDMIAYGNVVVISDSGTTLHSDTLKWDNERQKIISEIPVMITSGLDTLFGDTFISDPNLENYEITNSHGSGTQLLRKK